MGLGRTEKLHLSCAYEGREDDCPKNCSKCAISMKTDGDIALSSNRLQEAIRHYKKALFVEPRFAEAWCNLANAYGMNSEYNNALAAFNKALSIDSKYGKAMLGKAITLRNLGKPEAALTLANEILDLYDDPSVLSFIGKLKNAGVKDKSRVYSLSRAVDLMTEKAFQIAETNSLLDPDGDVHAIQEIYVKEEFANSIYSFCKKRYSSLGEEKVWSESILGAFFGSTYIASEYYKMPDSFSNVDPVSFLYNNVNLEELDRNAEKALGIRGDEEQSEKVWNVIYPFVTYAISIVAEVEPTSDKEAAVLDAAESAYFLGMLLGMRHHEDEMKNTLSLLDRLHDQIEFISKRIEDGTTNRTIIDAAKSIGLTPEQYIEQLKNDCSNTKRIYNDIIDRWNLSDKKKFIIDSFSDNLS